MEQENYKTPAEGWARCGLSDTEITALVIAGNEAAFEGIMRRYNRLLYRLARSILQNNEDAEDAVQESYVRAYFNLKQFKGPGGFPTWLSRIAINEALSKIRKNKLPDDHSVNPDEIPTEAGVRPDRVAMSEDTLRLIEPALDTLPQDFRLVFMLRAVEELSVNETAEILSINPATVKTRFFRARRLMRKSLSRRIGDAAPRSFYFAGERCNRIVARTFQIIAGTDSKAQ